MLEKKFDGNSITVTKKEHLDNKLKLLLFAVF